MRTPNAKAGDPVTIEADVTNTGAVSGEEVAELYLTQPTAFETPLRTLAGFMRVHVDPGKVAHVQFIVMPRTLGQVDKTGTRIILPGEYKFSVGSAQPGDAANTVTGSFTVTGSSELFK